ncbi:MAG: Trp biosynthesis-associated membrane protein [Dermatophilus congolensis]|nr:Trp biosynthesis-associated membrane protein [Dermatophilus congolensis]
MAVGELGVIALLVVVFISVAVFALLLRMGKGGSKRFDRPTSSAPGETRRADGTADRDSVSDWDRLSRGDDPTAGD